MNPPVWPVSPKTTLGSWRRRSSSSTSRWKQLAERDPAVFFSRGTLRTGGAVQTDFLVRRPGRRENPAPNDEGRSARGSLQAMAAGNTNHIELYAHHYIILQRRRQNERTRRKRQRTRQRQRTRFGRLRSSWRVRALVRGDEQRAAAFRGRRLGIPRLVLRRFFVGCLANRGIRFGAGLALRRGRRANLDLNPDLSSSRAKLRRNHENQVAVGRRTHLRSTVDHSRLRTYRDGGEEGEGEKEEEEKEDEEDEEKRKGNEEDREEEGEGDEEGRRRRKWGRRGGGSGREGRHREPSSTSTKEECCIMRRGSGLRRRARALARQRQ